MKKQRRTEPINYRIDEAYVEGYLNYLKNKEKQRAYYKIYKSMLRIENEELTLSAILIYSFIRNKAYMYMKYTGQRITASKNKEAYEDHQTKTLQDFPVNLTNDEIQKELGVKSSTTVRNGLKALEKLGFIQIKWEEDSKKRRIRKITILIDAEELIPDEKKAIWRFIDEHGIKIGKSLEKYRVDWRQDNEVPKETAADDLATIATLVEEKIVNTADIDMDELEW